MKINKKKQIVNLLLELTGEKKLFSFSHNFADILYQGRIIHRISRIEDTINKLE